MQTTTLGRPAAEQGGGWEQRLADIVQTMREMSRQTDPQMMVQAYGSRVRKINPADRMVALSRRGLPAPQYRITRSSTWKPGINPWKQKQLLPLLDRGLLGELLYGDEPRIIDDLHVPDDDPAGEYFQGMRSLQAVPLFDDGVALNMVVVMRKEPAAFDRERLPEQVWIGNLFGLATQNLVLSDDLKRAYEAVDRELQAVAHIQRSLLPAELPHIPTLQLAAYYQTARRAGGDYYDFFPLPDGKWGILVADVSGHGTPAAVLMAITHSIAHLCCDPPAPPARLLGAVNARLSTVYTADSGNFVTAGYGVYDPAERTIAYASAGHPPPRVRRADGHVAPLKSPPGLPLGIDPDEQYDESVHALHPGDTILFYTDGITEARDPDGDLFEAHRLDEVLSHSEGDAQELVSHTLAAVERFARGLAPFDDQTLLAARVIEE